MTFRDDLEQLVAESIDHTQFKLDADELEAATQSVVNAVLARYGVVDLVDLDETRVWVYAANVEIDDRPASVSIDVPDWVVSKRSMIDLSTPTALRDIAAVLLSAANRAEDS